MIKVQRIIVPDTGQRSWVLFDGGRQPIVAPNQYLSYLFVPMLTISRRFSGFCLTKDGIGRF